MVSIVLTSHGTFAEGIKMSGEMIFGPQSNVTAVTLMPDMGPDDLKARLLEAVEGFEDKDEVLFLVDLQGGTPWNQVSLLLDGGEHPNWVAVSGLNLPMLVSALGSRLGAETAAAVAAEILPEARTGIVCKPESIEPAAPAAAPAAPAARGTIPEGTVLGDGHIKFVLCRVDTRLLHGQVATSWTKTTNPDRIIVVSDAVAHDSLRKSMIEQAAPPGVRAHVVPLAKMAEVCRDPRFGATKAMLLFENPQDLLRALDMGVEVKEVNLGSIAHSVGKVVVTDAIAVDSKDVEALEAIAAKGVRIDVRKVPASSPESFEGIMKKAKAELAKA